MSTEVPPTNKPVRPATPEEPKSYKAYWIAGGVAVTAGALWFFGIPQNVIEKITSYGTEGIKHAATGANAVAEVAPLANVAVLAAVSGGTPNANKTTDVFEEALKKSSGNRSPAPKPDKLDKLLAGVNEEELLRKRKQIVGPHSLQLGNRKVPIEITDSSNPFAILNEASKQLFSADNLENAAKAVSEAQVGQPFDVEFYKLQIQHLCKKDPYKYEPLLTKLELIEKAQSPVEMAKEALKNQAISAGIGGVAGVAGSFITGLFDRFTLNWKEDKTKQEALDLEFMKIIEDENCDHIVDAKKFKEIAEGVFERNPIFAMSKQAKYERCLSKVRKT